MRLIHPHTYHDVPGRCVGGCISISGHQRDAVPQGFNFAAIGADARGCEVYSCGRGQASQRGLEAEREGIARYFSGTSVVEL
ncbi:MAG: hypothetical protein I3J02_07885 [Prevotella sp.]|nr:hypothetical protein [Prevotella sp.]